MKGVRGFLLSLDAIFAISILVLVSILLGGMMQTYSSPEIIYQRYYYSGKDLVHVMEVAPLSSIEHLPVVQSYVLAGILSEDDMNRTILDVIGSFWASDNMTEAAGLTSGILDSLFNESGYDYEILLSGESVYNSSMPPRNSFLARLSTVVSGYEKTRPVNGYAAKVYLSKVSKSASSFIYFGGYVGEGNMTVLAELPLDANVSMVYMELNSGSNFSLYINNQPAGKYNKTAAGFSADKWIVCSASINPSVCKLLSGGNNTMNLNFSSRSNSSIGGGYIKIVYYTSDLVGSYQYGNMSSGVFRLPGISGIINIYSSFYVPGTLENMTAYLHYRSQYPVYFTMGNTSLLERGNSTEQAVLLNSTYINSTLYNRTRMDSRTYTSNRTIPIRFGTRNISYTGGLGGVLDVALITDRTSSMDTCDVDINCTEPGICDASSPCHEDRYKVLMKSDKSFIDAVLNVSGNTISLVGYGKETGPVCSFHDFSGDNSSLQSHVDDYANGWCGWTCISCGVESATKAIMENQVLYGANRSIFINRSSYDIGGGTRQRSVNVTFNVMFNQTAFVKARLSILGKNLDPNDKSYRNCIYLNGRYLGRMCYPGEDIAEGYHDCIFDLRPEWINNGINRVNVTSGTSASCGDSGGTHDDWEFKDVKVVLWEMVNNTLDRYSQIVSGEYAINRKEYADYKEYVDIWELRSDLPYPLDFTSGINSTNNTFGPGLGNDGWDWDTMNGTGPYGYDDDMDYNGVVSGRIEFDARTGSPARNRCTGMSCSGAYGIQINITSAIYSKILAGDSLFVTFDYEWDGNDDPFEDDDQVWIKSRWYSPTSGYHWLGSNLDSSYSGGDATPEVSTNENPDDDFSGHFVYNLTRWVEGAGWYYFDLGGKLLASSNDEWGYFMFDNISIGLTNSSLYYPTTNFTKNVTFSLDANSTLKAARLKFEAKNVDPYYYNCIYLNGYYAGKVRHQEWSGVNEWQNVSLDIPVMWIRNGSNDFTFTAGTRENLNTGIDGGCMREGGSESWNLRNTTLETTYINVTDVYGRYKSMLVMSDGNANTRIGDCDNCQDGTPTPSEQAVAKACEAHNLYNISIYAVAFGSGADPVTMQDIACCDNCSHFFTSENSEELVEIYRNIARDMLRVSYQAQAVEVSGNVSFNNTLYPDSYIEYVYRPVTKPLSYGEITLNFETQRLGDMSGNSTITDNSTGTKTGWFSIQNDTDILDAKMTSYSSSYWTDRLWVNSSNTPNRNWTRIYWLGNFSSQYSELGDPYVINMPVNLLKAGGNNSVKIGVGLNTLNGSGGSPDDRIIYTIGIHGVRLTEYTDVFPRMKGSTVTVYYDTNGDNVPEGSSVIQVGPDPSDIFDPENDSIDNGLLKLLDSLDFMNDLNPSGTGNGSASNPYDGINGTNPVDLQITSDFSFDSEYISQIPSLWGPAELEIRIWK